MRVVGLCGTPGTGKKTLAPLVARIMGLPAVSINSLASGGGEVEPKDLRRALLKLAPREAVVYGHLLPSVIRRPEAEFVALLRCEPSVLRSRLEARGYSGDKVRENVEAELIGVLLDECLRTFGEGVVKEYDTTSAQPNRVARAIAADAKGGERGAPREWIDWTVAYDSSTKLRSLLEGRREPRAST